jgi:hypothetical protein
MIKQDQMLQVVIQGAIVECEKFIDRDDVSASDLDAISDDLVALLLLSSWKEDWAQLAAVLRAVAVFERIAAAEWRGNALKTQAEKARAASQIKNAPRYAALADAICAVMAEAGKRLSVEQTRRRVGKPMRDAGFRVPTFNQVRRATAKLDEANLLPKK